MKIRSVAAQNYRTLVNFEHSFDSGYCAISGPNNAGKSCIIKIIQHFLEDQERGLFSIGRQEISFEHDRTQWIDCEHLEVSICLEISRDEDSEAFFFIDKFTAKKIEADSFDLKLVQIFRPNKSSTTSCFIGADELDEKTSIEVFKKMKSSANIVVHNSTNAGVRRTIFGDGFTQLAESQMDDKDKKNLKEAERQLKQKISQVAKKQTEQLTAMLVRLDESYVIDLTTVEALRIAAFPLAVSLQDKHVQGPLQEWGSGTRNRTEILMSLMEAARIKAAASEENRTTPAVILEEPESFLHPIAQAEFGKLLTLLSDELGIQIIATTHSPYMLNHGKPESNTLVRRKIEKKKYFETEIVDTTGENWMEPFSSILGIIPPEFSSWRTVLGLNSDSVVLVEGEIDKKYFEYFRSSYPDVYQISNSVVIEAYGGKDSLQNVALLRFARRRFKKMFVTFDRDAEMAVVKSLKAIGMVENVDFLAVGNNAAGSDCIEGLVPDSITSAVYARELSLVRAASSQKAEIRKSAKNNLKHKLYDAMIEANLDAEDFSDFKKMFSAVNKGLKRSQ
jgi:putative ATP-dependent endonuclease of the OLD family